MAHRDASALPDDIDALPADISTLPDLDFAFLDRQTFGDAELAHEVLTLFLGQAGRLLPTLPDLPPARQTETAHLVKGSCQGIGAIRLAELLQRYDDGDVAARRQIQPALSSAFDRVRTAILDRLSPG